MTRSLYDWVGYQVKFFGMVLLCAGKLKAGLSLDQHSGYLRRKARSLLIAMGGTTI